MSVHAIPKPFILMKTLAAGRLPPSEAFQFVAESAKPDDFISIGMGSVEELEETVGLTEKWLTCEVSKRTACPLVTPAVFRRREEGRAESSDGRRPGAHCRIPTFPSPSLSDPRSCGEDLDE